MVSFPNPRARAARFTFAAAAPAVAALALGAWALAGEARPAQAKQTPGMTAPNAPNPLNLTADQKNKMKAINLKYKPAADKLREQMRVLAMKADKEMMALLTPAQKTKLKQLQTAQLQQMQQMQAGANGAARPR